MHLFFVCLVSLLLVTQSIAATIASTPLISGNLSDSDKFPISRAGSGVAYTGDVSKLKNAIRPNEVVVGADADALTLVAANTDVDNIGKTIVLNSPVTLAANLTLATDRAWRFEKGAVITTTGYTFNANGASVDIGDYQVFTGSGSVIGFKESHSEWFGAKRDGTTDDAAAIDSAIASLSSGGLLQLEAGTYIAGTFSTRTGTSSSLFVPKSNITIQGRGDVTVIKAKSGLSPGEWKFFGTTTELLTNCIFRDFKLDGSDNLNGATARPNWYIGSSMGAYNVLIDNVTFTNQPGNNTIAFSGTTGTRGLIVVNNCRFTEMGSGKPGNTCADHSDIYLHGENNKITNNYFKSTNYVDGAAMEFHGDLGEAYGNYVNGYNVPFYIAPNGQTFTKTSVHHNTFNNVLSFGFLAPDGTGVLGDALVHNNTFTRIASATPGYGFSGSDELAEPAGTISIIGNNFIGNTGDDCYLIHVGYAKNIIVKDNYAKGFYAGVQINTGGDVHGDTYTHHAIDISGNTFTGLENYPVTQSSATCKIKSLSLVGNTFTADTSQAFGAFVFAGTADTGKVTGNTIYNYNNGSSVPAGVDTDYVWSQSFTIDPPSLAAGAVYTYDAVMLGITIPGQVIVTPPYDMQGVTIYGYVQAANHVYIQFRNATGGAVDLVSGTFKVQVKR